MSGYDAVTVEACALAARQVGIYQNGRDYTAGAWDAAAAIRALPIAPPAPLQVTADDVTLVAALRKAVSYYRAYDWPESDTDLLTQAADALARRAAPAVDETADEGPTRAELLEMDLAQTNALVDQQADKLSRLQGHFASMIIDPDVCAVAKDIARAALNREGNAG